MSAYRRGERVNSASCRAAFSALPSRCPRSLPFVKRRGPPLGTSRPGRVHLAESSPEGRTEYGRPRPSQPSDAPDRNGGDGRYAHASDPRTGGPRHTETRAVRAAHVDHAAGAAQPRRRDHQRHPGDDPGVRAPDRRPVRQDAALRRRACPQRVRRLAHVPGRARWTTSAASSASSRRTRAASSTRSSPPTGSAPRRAGAG